MEVIGNVLECVGLLSKTIVAGILALLDVLMYVLYLCGSSDLSSTINVIYLANFNHHLSCITALHRRLYVQWVNTYTYIVIYRPSYTHGLLPRPAVTPALGICSLSRYNHC